jgi:hypothetical protein
MNHFFKLLIFACSIFSIVGVLIIINLVTHRPLNLPDNLILEIIGFLFWYLQPILSLILIFASKKRRIKYFGGFFFITSAIAWLSYIFTP